MVTHQFEGNIRIPVVKRDIVTKNMGTFYNPKMKDNRDITINVLNVLSTQKGSPITIADPLAGSGIRTARILKEIDPKKIEQVYINDIASSAIQTIQETLTLNDCPKKYTLHHKDASAFLIEIPYCDYIDIDPFGSPNLFLDAACKKIVDQGIIAITATDTSALCGTYPNACLRKYYANSYRTPFMHELALRILLRKIQMVAGQYERAALPLFCYAQEHYVRIFVRISKGKSRVDEIIKNHKTVTYNPTTGEWNVDKKTKQKNDIIIGPMYVGTIHDIDFLKQMQSHPITDKLIEESKVNSVGFYHMPFFGRKLKTTLKPLDHYLKALKGVRTHCDGQGIKTNKPFKQVIKIIEKISKS